MKKILALCLSLLLLAGIFRSVGFTGEEIRSIVGDGTPNVRLETAERFKAVIGG